MRIASAVVVALVIVGSSARVPAGGRPADCTDAVARVDGFEHDGYPAARKGAYRQAVRNLRAAVVLYAACPRQTKRDDEAATRQMLAAALWHLGDRGAAFAELRTVRRLNETLQFTDGVAPPAPAFAKRDYRKGFALVRAGLSDAGIIALPVSLWDSGAADAIRRALDAGAAGHFNIALANANDALKRGAGSQATRLVAGIASLATMHPRRGRDLLFDAALGYDANPRGEILTNLSLMSVYVLVAVGSTDERSPPTAARFRRAIRPSR